MRFVHAGVLLDQGLKIGLSLIDLIGSYQSAVTKESGFCISRIGGEYVFCLIERLGVIAAILIDSPSKRA